MSGVIVFIFAVNILSLVQLCYSLQSHCHVWCSYDKISINTIMPSAVMLQFTVNSAMCGEAVSMVYSQHGHCLVQLAMVYGQHCYFMSGAVML